MEWTEMAGVPLAGTYRTPERVTVNVIEKLAVEWTAGPAVGPSFVVILRAWFLRDHKGRFVVLTGPHPPFLKGTFGRPSLGT